MGASGTRSNGSTAARQASARPCSSSPWEVSLGQECHHVWDVPAAWASTPRPSVLAGVFAPTLFSKVYGKLVCGECHNVTQNPLGHYLCHNCHFDLVSEDMASQLLECGAGDTLDSPGSCSWQWGCPLSCIFTKWCPLSLSADGQQWHPLLQSRPVSVCWDGVRLVPSLGWHLQGSVMVPHPSQLLCVPQ